MDSGSIFNWGPNLSYTGVEFKMKVIISVKHYNYMLTVSCQNEIGSVGRFCLFRNRFYIA